MNTISLSELKAIRTDLLSGNSTGAIEALNKHILAMSRKNSLKALQTELQAYLKKTYFPNLWSVLTDISSIVANCGFETKAFETADFSFHSDPTLNMANLPIGQNVYLTLTWYQMESGNIEIIGYAS